MKLKDVVERAILILGLEQEVDADVPSIKLMKLIDCANAVIAELALAFVALKNKETLIASDNKIYYTAFEKPVREVLSLKDSSGAKVPFEQYPAFIETVGNGAFEVTYLFHNGSLALADEVLTPPQFSVYILAIGVAAEYFYRIGLVDEAQFYRNRYDNALARLTNRVKSVVLPSRRLV